MMAMHVGGRVADSTVAAKLHSHPPGHFNICDGLTEHMYAIAAAKTKAAVV